MRRALPLAALLFLGAVAAPATAQSVLPPAPLDNTDMEHVANVPDLVGNNLAFFEREQEDGTVKRYVVASTVGNGFDILDITDPTGPTTVGQYLLGGGSGPETVQQSSLGANYHPWVDVNPRRNIVALTIENPGLAVRHGVATGMQFVDISDVTNPVPLGSVEGPEGGADDGLTGPHTVRMVGESCAWTSLNSYVVDYSDPMSPVAHRRPLHEIHEIWEDPNIPNRAYVGTATPGKWEIWDISDCLNPEIITTVRDVGYMAHEAYPSPDSSYVGVADFAGGQTHLGCPGGAIHFYDISGKYVAGASLQEPRKMGVYFAPFEGLPTGSGNQNYASCTPHSWQVSPEREIALAGLYTGGTWVFDPSRATQTGGAFAEYDGPRGKTTWGNTLGNNRDALDFVNATQWYPFEAADPADERLVFTVGWERGLDVYRYTGPLPEKLARIRVENSAPGGAVTGTLERFAVLTHAGWQNPALADQPVEVSAGSTTVQATTGEDGTFTADLGLGAGTHEVTVTWAGNDAFRGETATSTVVVS